MNLELIIKILAVRSPERRREKKYTIATDSDEDDEKEYEMEVKDQKKAHTPRLPCIKPKQKHQKLKT